MFSLEKGNKIKNNLTKKYSNDYELQDLIYLRSQKTVVIAQSVRALDCGSRGRGFDPHCPPKPR